MNHKKMETRKAEGKKGGFLNKSPDTAGTKDLIRRIHATLIAYPQFERVVKEMFPHAKIRISRNTATAVCLSKEHPDAYIKLDVDREEITHFGLSRIFSTWYGKNASIQLATLFGMDMTAHNLETEKISDLMS